MGLGNTKKSDKVSRAMELFLKVPKGGRSFFSMSNMLKGNKAYKIVFKHFQSKPQLFGYIVTSNDCSEESLFIFTPVMPAQHA